MKASAPGKVILIGEHAVVYGRPALAVPVTQVRAEAEVTTSSRPGVWIDAPGIGLRAELASLPSDDPLSAVIQRVLAAVHVHPAPDLTIQISSTIPVASGLGSGTAVSVALIRALASALGRSLSTDRINELAYEVEKLHHGTPSGIDNTVITYECPVYFIKDRPVVVLSGVAPFTIVIGDTGIPAPTRASVGDVRRLWEADRAKYEGLFDQIGDLADKARSALEAGALPLLGTLMDQNHERLQQLTVSSAELDHLVQVARSAGALGAKLSGGGRGGNMIALVRKLDADKVAGALRAAGSPRVIVTAVAPAPSGLGSIR